MNTTRTANGYDALEDDIRETLIEAGFMPLEAGSPDQLADEILTARDAKVLDYFHDRRWDAFRLEAAGTGAWATLAAWSEDGIKLMAIDRNGVISNEARLDMTPEGAAWLAKLVA